MRLRAVCRVLAAAVLVLPTAGAGTAAMASAVTSSSRTTSALAGGAAGLTAHVPAADLADPADPAPSGAAVLTLGSISPTIAAPGDTVTITGTLRNDTPTPLVKPVVRAVLGRTTLVRRSDVDAWANDTTPAQGREVAREQLPATVAPGSSAPFVLEVEKATGLGEATYGALPLSIESSGAALRTFAGYQRIKQYQPIDVAWLVPLTVDPDAALFGATGAAREAAWERVLGAGSRLQRVIEATRDEPVTWAIDPTLVPSLLPDDADAPDAAGTKDPGSTELMERKATEQAIRYAAPAHSPWVLPDTDADVAAASATGGATRLVGSLVSRAQVPARSLGGRADIAWPADGVQSPAREGALRGLYAGPGLRGQVAAAATLPRGVNTPDAAQRSQGGLPVLAFDDRLSSLLQHTTSLEESVLSAQRFIADSVVLLDERPGTEGRTLLVAAPRTFDPDAAGARSFFHTVTSLPWLDTVTTGALLEDAAKAVPLPNVVATQPGTACAKPRTPARDPLTGGRAVLTRTRGDALDDSFRTVNGVALIRDDGNAFARTWGRAAQQLASARWRTAPSAWSTLQSGVLTATRKTTSAVKVSPRNVNFLAESGRLQITVTNDLDVAVENVKLTLEPANPRLRIDSQPPILRIGAKSRATVAVGVTSLAAGLVPIRTTLTTPDGTVIGQGAQVQVRVTPTGNWIYWVFGGLAAVILVAGIWRSVRRRPHPQVPSADPTTAGVP